MRLCLVSIEGKLKRKALWRIAREMRHQEKLRRGEMDELLEYNCSMIVSSFLSRGELTRLVGSPRWR
jgi:hypothetical protein